MANAPKLRLSRSAIADEGYSRLIEASPIVALATSGPEGIDCSPRGDPGQVVVDQG
jgi:predicted pyridoxine 5'-phosphate oxidase superfamily flavin-nucleotide-binding protein